MASTPEFVYDPEENTCSAEGVYLDLVGYQDTTQEADFGDARGSVDDERTEDIETLDIQETQITSEEDCIVEHKMNMCLNSINIYRGENIDTVSKIESPVVVYKEFKYREYN